MSNVDMTPSSGSSGASSPKETAAAAAQTVKQEVASFASSMQDRAKEEAEQKKQAATQTLGDFAAAIRKAGDDLAQHDRSVAGRLVKQAADGLEAFTQSMTDKQPEELLGAVRDFGRRNPLAFVGGALLVGVALGRFLRSSAPQQQDAATYGYDSSGYPTTYSAAAYAAQAAGSDGTEEAEALDHATYAVEEPDEARPRPGSEL